MLDKWIYDHNIIKVIDGLILNEGYRYYRDCDPLDQESLTVMIMNLMGDEAISILNFKDESIVLNHWKKYIVHGGIDEALMLAQTLRKLALEYFEHSFAEVFEERRNILLSEIKDEQVHNPVTDTPRYF